VTVTEEANTSLLSQMMWTTIHVGGHFCSAGKKIRKKPALLLVVVVAVEGKNDLK